ncbi:ferritin-like protein [Hymenobacter cellulosilyticus]|uniref:Ferritin-like protein n=1 Tax=Hymenobacter cellulosilyticus TaxID=2932248 RepID=A0A8T9QG25_9BACT|nr:ferritin-like protein [Hymenobacter cellulosilyticus]UOQ75108.1 ferritin-like protein [Hymenobacter cellulosilyticus]
MTQYYLLAKDGIPNFSQESTSDWFMLSYTPKVNWDLPVPPAELARKFYFVDHQTVLRTELQVVLANVGVPSVEGAENAVEFAIGLLRLAAEVEHALMVQYLYAAFSVANGPAVDGINYREKILDVAIQEMGHLATVQNILILLGGPEAVYMQRDVMRQASAKNPIPFVLEPISLAALAKYVAAEKPAVVPADVAEKVDRLVKLAAESVGGDTHRVGAIYGVLQSLFDTGERILPELAHLPFNPRLNDADLRPKQEVSAYQATREEWEADENSFLLIEAFDCASAQAAISQIAEQGEGLSDRSDSHFSEFLEMAEAYEQGPLRDMVTDLPISPTLGAHGGEGEHLLRILTPRFGAGYLACNTAR